MTRFARIARAGVLGVVAVSLASAAHLLAGGVVPSAAALALIAGVVAASSAPVLGVRASTRRIVALVLAQQVALHVLFAYIGLASGRMVMGSAPMAMPGMHMAGMGGATSLTHGPSVSWSMLSGHLMGDLGTGRGAAMTVTHLAAAALVGWWLAVGERLLWSLVIMLAAAGAAALLRGAAALLAIVRAGSSAGELWGSALRRQRGGRWHVRSWEPVSRLELRGPPGLEVSSFA